MRKAQAGAAPVVGTILRAVLCFSLLVAFTTSAAAALCLQMEHHGAPAVNDAPVAVDMPVPAGSPSAKACCYQQSDSPNAVVVQQRALPAEPAAFLPAVEALLTAPDDGEPPPGAFTPALEKRDHLTPSLTALSISRT
ncbi:hypothetical protein [Arthrobacter subterraneus]|uniref:hypothetical protein n=1 Tax=Arthrobacter subterraneus TaxID=335973 RepID=UPI00382EACD1